MKILIVEDEKVLHSLVGDNLTECGYQVIHAYNGEEGLLVASANEPDLLIVDNEMPILGGTEMIRRLRMNERFQDTPVIVLSGSTKVEVKLNAFDAGADDFVEKPYDLHELRARISRLLLRRSKSTEKSNIGAKAKVIGVHSVRGGAGCSSIAANLALSLQYLWDKKTLLVDACSEGGQVALLLNGQGARTWGDLTQFKTDSLDPYIVERILNNHPSGLRFLASPKMRENVPAEFKFRLFEIVDHLEQDYDYIVIDFGRSWDPSTRAALRKCGGVACIVAPDVGSMENAVSAQDRYDELEIDEDKILIVLNDVCGRRGLTHEQVKSALRRELNATIPFSPKAFQNFLNSGLPIVSSKNIDTPLAKNILRLAFNLSKESHVSVPPASPTAAWVSHFRDEKLRAHSILSNRSMMSITAFSAVNLLRQYLVQ